MSSQYEFNSEENVVFSKLASAMKTVGIFTIVIGVLSMFALFSGDMDIVRVGVVTGAWCWVLGVGYADGGRIESHP
jgi:hypothetical protein